MGKITSPSEYRQKVRKEISLPSGAVFEIKRLEGDDLLLSPNLPLGFNVRDLASRLPVISEKYNQDPTSVSNEEMADFLEMLYVIAVVGTVNPRLSFKAPSECADNELSIFELTLEDRVALAQEVLNFSGFTQEAVMQMAPFLEGGASDNNRQDGSEIPQASFGDTQS